MLSKLFSRRIRPTQASCLAELKPGQSARITALEGQGPLVQRLYEMGLLEGTQITLVRCAPLGDPLEIRVLGYGLSLRKAEAAWIKVDLL